MGKDFWWLRFPQLQIVFTPTIISTTIQYHCHHFEPKIKKHWFTKTGGFQCCYYAPFLWTWQLQLQHLLRLAIKHALDFQESCMDKGFTFTPTPPNPNVTDLFLACSSFTTTPQPHHGFCQLIFKQKAYLSIILTFWRLTLLQIITIMNRNI